MLLLDLELLILLYYVQVRTAIVMLLHLVSIPIDL